MFAKNLPQVWFGKLFVLGIYDRDLVAPSDGYMQITKAEYTGSHAVYLSNFKDSELYHACSNLRDTREPSQEAESGTFDAL